MSFTRRYTEDQREAIYQLKSQGKSGGDIVRLCARGVRGLPPFEIDRNYANRIARDEAFARQDVGPAHDDPHQALRSIVSGMIEVAERWFDRQRRRPKVDAMEFKRMTSSLADLRKLMADLPALDPPNGSVKEPEGFLAELAAQVPDRE